MYVGMLRAEHRDPCSQNDSTREKTMPPLVRLNPGAPRQAARTTLAFYERFAEEFWRGTQDHDVSQNRTALLGHVAGDGPYTILDFGCGPGRDLAAFRALGHEAVGLDGAERFVAMARQRTGCEVWHQDFLDLRLPPERFDGIFANASLFHIPSQELPRVLAQLWHTLKPDGVLFSSNPHGRDQEGLQDHRYGSFYTFETWRQFLTKAKFQEVTHYYRPPGKPRQQQPWLATIWRKGVA